MSSVARFDTWQAADGTNVARFASGELQVWDGSAWGPAGPSNAVVSGTTGSPTETTDGSATIYKYTGDGSITISRAGFVRLLVVGGGGSGATSGAGGGGGGGMLEIDEAYLPVGTHTIVVGTGGLQFNSAGNFDPYMGKNGVSSSLGDFVAPGGGGGACSIYRFNTTSYFSQPGLAGGSGGGGVKTATDLSMGFAGGVGTSGLGNDGGAGGTADSQSGGGGGAGAAGQDGASSSPGGNGGNGLASDITGTSITYAGGGGGLNPTPGVGGTGGGGDAAFNAEDGTDELGGGGGGGRGGTGQGGGDGGSGIVIVRVG